MRVNMTEQQTIKLLKVFIVIGICLLLLGHYLLSYANFPEKYGVTGMVISASCIAFGLVFSLPTKMYLTFLWVKKENDDKKNNPKSSDVNTRSEDNNNE